NEVLTHIIRSAPWDDRLRLAQSNHKLRGLEKLAGEAVRRHYIESVQVRIDEYQEIKRVYLKFDNFEKVLTVPDSLIILKSIAFTSMIKDCTIHTLDNYELPEGIISLLPLFHSYHLDF
ncbi:hypothetical protein PFISCL1PPCAC_6439, partial [Pristionchus fissidentatus]